MQSTCNEGKSAIVERFIRTLKNKIFKHMIAVSKNFYFDVLDDSVNKYNNTIHRTIKIKSIDVTSDSQAEYSEHSNKKDSKFNVGDGVRISKKKKKKNSFAKGCTENWLDEVFIVSKVKNTVLWAQFMNSEPITRGFYEKIAKTKSKRIQNRKNN